MKKMLSKLPDTFYSLQEQPQPEDMIVQKERVSKAYLLCMPRREKKEFYLLETRAGKLDVCIILTHFILLNNNYFIPKKYYSNKKCRHCIK